VTGPAALVLVSLANLVSRLKKITAPPAGEAQGSGARGSACLGKFFWTAGGKCVNVVLGKGEKI